MSRNDITIYCSKCGKKLIQRLPNGLWHFIFGKTSAEDKMISMLSPVEMLIYGSLKMKCIRRSCRSRYPDHWNILNFFPDKKDTIGIEEDSGINKIIKERR